jgi:hypothetical protein
VPQAAWWDAGEVHDAGTQRSRLLIPVILAVALTGCRAAARGIPGPDVLVTFRQTGGIAGVDKRLTVTTHGDVRLVQARPRRREVGGKLSTEELAALRRRLVAADFRGLPRRSVNQQFRDGFEYTLSLGPVAGQVEGEARLTLLYRLACRSASETSVGDGWRLVVADVFTGGSLRPRDPACCAPPTEPSRS